MDRAFFAPDRRANSLEDNKTARLRRKRSASACWARALNPGAAFAATMVGVCPAPARCEISAKWRERRALHPHRRHAAIRPCRLRKSRLRAPQRYGPSMVEDRDADSYATQTVPANESS